MQRSFALLADGAKTWGIALDAGQLGQFERYAAELREWNAQLNLTAVDDLQGIVTRHFLDSLSIAQCWQAVPARLIDIGSGAGFPGLPLAIAMPQISVTLVESIEKRAAFLRHVAATLSLANVAVLTARAEQLGHTGQHREQYDIATARAVADLRVLAEYCVPLVCVGGQVLAPKGADVEQEVLAAERAVQLLGGRIAGIERVVIPQEPARALVVIDKISPTPQRYPRATGIPSKRPLS